MSWDAWALLAINAMCVAVIVWAAWGFRQESRNSRLLRIALTTGEYLVIPVGPQRGAGWVHRGQHRGWV
ncbi:hypothetical protein ABZ319_10610 [Nocardia sp. NPDC005978]|uniref:hypothetical protein n=1 Tax=Nocardia sp. NPDC005978 TaxID=3156725 RepID=UPI0033AFD31F